jgi:hypothetical protein
MLCYPALTAPHINDGFVRVDGPWDVHFYTSLLLANQSGAVALEGENLIWQPADGDLAFIGGSSEPTVEVSVACTSYRVRWHPFCCTPNLIANVLRHNFGPSRTGDLSDVQPS